jgi:cytochrome P450
VIQLYRWIRAPLDFLTECRARFGDTFTLRIAGGGAWVITENPETIREVWSAGPSEMHAGKANEILRPFLGDHSILMLDGERHLRVRRLMLPPFHGERMVAYGSAMLEIANAAIDKLPLREPFPIHPRFQAITMDVILRTVFGVEGASRHAELASVFETLLRIGAWPPLLIPAFQVDLGPLSPWGRFLRVGERADRLLRDEIDRRRREGTAGRTDVLSLLVDARDEEGKPMSVEELRDELVTLLVAGHETTATSLAWALRWILPDAALLGRLRDEIRTAEDGSGSLDPARVAKLELLDAAVRETLRLSPVVPLVARELMRPVRAGGFDLPVGVRLLPCIHLAQRRPEAFPNPERFDPDRFLQKSAKISPSEWFPFGGGIRRCVGMAFAMYEMKMVLAAVLSRATLRLASRRPIRPVRRAITLSPSEGLPVVLLARAPRSGPPRARREGATSNTTELPTN